MSVVIYGYVCVILSRVIMFINMTVSVGIIVIVWLFTVRQIVDVVSVIIVVVCG